MYRKMAVKEARLEGMCSIGARAKTVLPLYWSLDAIRHN